MTDPEPSPQPYGQRQDDRLRAAGLTEMEEQILAGLAGGKTSWEICRELGISRSLYQLYVQMLRRYLGVWTTVEAVAVWVRERSDPKFIFRPCARLLECLPALEHDPHRPEDVPKWDTDEEGNGGDDAHDALRCGLMACPGTPQPDRVAARLGSWRG